MARVINLVRRSPQEFQYVEEEEVAPGIWHEVQSGQINLERIRQGQAAAPGGRRVAAPAVKPRALGLNTTQLTELARQSAARDKQIQAFAKTPIGYVWQTSKRLPGFLEKVPIPRPAVTPAEIEERFPQVRLPEEIAQTLQPPLPIRVFRGSLTTESGKVLNLWEDLVGNEIEGYREVPGEFGEAREILEY